MIYQNYVDGCDGFDFHIHAIGDAATQNALNGIQATKATGSCARHRLTHVELVDNADMKRFGELNVTADAQVRNLKWD